MDGFSVGHGQMAGRVSPFDGDRDVLWRGRIASGSGRGFRAVIVSAIRADAINDVAFGAQFVAELRAIERVNWDDRQETRYQLVQLFRQAPIGQPEALDGQGRLRYPKARQSLCLADGESGQCGQEHTREDVKLALRLQENVRCIGDGEAPRWRQACQRDVRFHAPQVKIQIAFEKTDHAEKLILGYPKNLPTRLRRAPSGYVTCPFPDQRLCHEVGSLGGCEAGE